MLMNEVLILFEKIRKIFNFSLLGMECGHIVFAIAAFCLVLLLSHVVKSLLLKVIHRPLERVNNDIYLRLLEALKLPFHIFSILFAFWIGSYALGNERIFEAVNRAFQTLFLVMGVWGVYRCMDVVVLVVKRITPLMDSVLQQYLTVVFSKVIKFLILITGAIMLLKEWGYDATGLIAGLGVGGLAISMGGKDFVANIFGFVTIFLDRPLAVGDWIQTPDVEGTVEDIGLRSTRVRTFAQALVTIPNSDIAFKQITNWSKMQKRRITFNLGLSYASSAEKIDQLCKRIRKMLEDHPDIHNDVILVYFTRYGDSSLDLFLYFFTKTIIWQEFLEVQHDVNLRIMRILEELSLQVAFPSRSIYMENLSVDSSKMIEELDRRHLPPTGPASKNGDSSK